MSARKPQYFNICKFLIEILLLVNFCFLSLNCTKNPVRRDFSAENRSSVSESAININTASVEELEKLPHIGATVARQIIAHREKFGAFRKPEHLMLIRGISDARFRAMRNLIKVE